MTERTGGARPARQAWTADRVVSEIRARQSAGLPLNSQAVVAEDQRLSGAARRYFGSWEAALEAAGIDPQAARHPRTNISPPGTWSPEKVLAAVRERLDAGLPMNAAAVRAENSRLYGAAVHQLGSWGAVCEALGLDYTGVRLNREWTPERVAESIQGMARERADLSVRTVEAFDPGLYQAAVAHFGSWDAACTAAGVEPPRRTVRWSRPRVIEAIQQGLHSGSPEVGGLREAAIRHFGSWQAAVDVAQPPVRVTCNLRRIREAQGLSLAEVGRRVGRSGQWVGLVELGSVVPDLALALLLARAVGATVEQVFSPA